MITSAITTMALSAIGSSMAPNLRFLLPQPGKIAVEPIGDRSDDEQRQRKPVGLGAMKIQKHDCNPGGAPKRRTVRIFGIVHVMPQGIAGEWGGGEA